MKYYRRDTKYREEAKLQKTHVCDVPTRGTTSGYTASHPNRYPTPVGGAEEYMHIVLRVDSYKCADS